MSTITEITEELNIPTVCGEALLEKAAVTLGNDYKELGILTEKWLQNFMEKHQLTQFKGLKSLNSLLIRLKLKKLVFLFQAVYFQELAR